MFFVRNCFHGGGRFDEVYAGLTREFGWKGITRLCPSTDSTDFELCVCVCVGMYRMIPMMVRV